MKIKGISNKIQDRLSLLRWDRARLAKKLDFSEKSLQRLLDSEDIKKLDTFVLICRYLGLSPLNLLASELLQHPFLEYFDIVPGEEDDGHLIKLIFEGKTNSNKRHLVFTKGIKGEYYAEHKASDFEGVGLAYPPQYSESYKEFRGLKVVQLTEETPELDLVKEDFVFCINKPNQNYSYTEYTRYGIGYAVAEFFNDDGSCSYGILKPISGKNTSFKDAMESEDNTVVFVDEKTYLHWLNTSLPKSKYDIKTFKWKVFHSIDFTQEEKFKLYPVIGFVKNLTKRITNTLITNNNLLK